MSNQKSKDTEKSKSKEEEIKASEASTSIENTDQEEERSGIIPEGMDFKKFIGCGG